MEGSRRFAGKGTEQTISEEVSNSFLSIVWKTLFSSTAQKTDELTSFTCITFFRFQKPEEHYQGCQFSGVVHLQTLIWPELGRMENCFFPHSVEQTSL